MSEAAAAPAPALAAGERPAYWALGRVRRVGLALLGLQLTGFLVWSTLLYRHFAVTYDFAAYHQAWFQIAHGHLNPYDSLESFPFWRNHFELIMWVLAPLYWLWPHGVTLLWLQDILIVGAEVAAFTWICELVQRARPRDAAWLAGVGLVSLAANPWIWASVSWDFHTESVTILLVVLTGRDLMNGRRRVWLWVPLLLTCGDVAGTYLAALSAGIAIASRNSRRLGILLACLGIGTMGFITLIHANQGAGHGMQSYAYLVASHPHGKLSPAEIVSGMLAHPWTALKALAAKRVDLLANIAPAGLIGIACPATFPLVALVLAESHLYPGLLFAGPGFQNAMVYIALPVGTVMALAWIARRHRRLAVVLAGLIAAQTVGWALVWEPRVPSSWLRVPQATAATLARVQSAIPSSAEVIASQGVVGRFSSRADVKPLMGPARIPLDGAQTWFVIAPTAGIEVQSTGGAMALIGKLAGSLKAHLVTAANGVWAFRWDPPAGKHYVTVPGQSAAQPAWAAGIPPGDAAKRVMAGPVRRWHMASDGAKGYVCAEIAWRDPPGWYRASVSLSARGPVNVEMWNDNGYRLLARRHLSRTSGRQVITFPVSVTSSNRRSVFSGWGPFRADFIPAPRGQRVELRVWSPGKATVNVYSARLGPLKERLTAGARR